MKSRNLYPILAAVALLLAALACGPVTPTAIPPTATPPPVEGLSPTPTPPPTEIPPTETPPPVEEPSPTPTPPPTETPTTPPGMPDLTVTDITLVEGNKIQCSYENVGDAEVPAGDMWLATYVDGVRVFHTNVGIGTTIPAGGEGWLRTTPLKFPASVEIRCVIDSDNNVAEADEGNNERTETLPPTAPGGMPDLTVADIALVEGDGIQCHYRNIGDAEILEGPVWIAIYVGKERVCHSTVWTPILTWTPDLTWREGWLRIHTLSLPTSVEVRCVIDSDDNVVEADERNNALVETLHR